MQRMICSNSQRFVVHDPGKGCLYSRYIKRTIDFILSLFAITILSPALLFLSILVKAELGGPVIFKQKRPGLYEEIFTLYKFRTMTDRKDENGALLPDAIRLTPLGKFLRSTSLDELPELFNILKGDMSIVGPRPLAVAYLPFYTYEERLRHSVRPGLTGLAQINGRNALNWEERFRYDAEYIKTITFAHDAAIILKTVIKVFRRSEIGVRGIDAPLDFDLYRRLQATADAERFLDPGQREQKEKSII